MSFFRYSFLLLSLSLVTVSAQSELIEHIRTTELKNGSAQNCLSQKDVHPNGKISYDVSASSEFTSQNAWVFLQLHVDYKECRQQNESYYWDTLMGFFPVSIRFDRPLSPASSIDLEMDLSQFQLVILSDSADGRVVEVVPVLFDEEQMFAEVALRVEDVLSEEQHKLFEAGGDVNLDLRVYVTYTQDLKIMNPSTLTPNKRKVAGNGFTLRYVLRKDNQVQN